MALSRAGSLDTPTSPSDYMSRTENLSIELNGSNSLVEDSFYGYGPISLDWLPSIVAGLVKR